MITGNEKAMPEIFTDAERHGGDIFSNTYSCDGLTIRQQFAAMALQGLLAKDSWAEQIVKDVSGNTIKLYAEASVKCADALIAELNKTKE